MKKGIVKKFAAVTLSAAITAAMALPGMAATSYEPVEGTSCNFNKYLIMDAGDTVPNATFAFTVAPGTAQTYNLAGTNKTMEVLAGVGTPTIANITFAPTDSTATDATGLIDINRNNVARGGSAGDTVQLDAGEKFATKEATVDFSSVSFTEPGIYRYIISETANADHAAAGIIHDTDIDRVLDVYVTDDGDGTLVVSSYVLHTSTADAPVAMGTNNGSADVSTAGAALDDKTDGFTNEYVSKDLKIEKEVTGNQASRDKYFEFTVTCTDVADADSYVVSIADDGDASTNDGTADATSGEAKPGGTSAANANKENPATVTGAQLKAGVKFYLQHGQSIVIRGLAPNAEYTVVENAEDYSSAVKSGDTNTGVIGTVAGDSKMAVAGFTNTRDGVIPTGVWLQYGIPAAVVLAAIAAFVVYKVVRKKDDGEEETA